MNFVLTPALTCFLSPRRGQRDERFLVGGKLSGKSSRANFQRDGERFSLSSEESSSVGYYTTADSGKIPGESRESEAI
jgi:hypothetical protein